MTHVLIVEDEPSQRFSVGRLIEKRFGYRVSEAENGKQALDTLEKESIGLVIMDLHMPVMDGLEALPIMVEHYPNIPVIMLTSSDDTAVAVQAVRMGAVDFLPKPADFDRLSVAIFNALKMNSLARELEHYKRKESGSFHFTDLVGYDSGLAPLLETARKAASSNLPILITGETGVGKEVLARAIHGESKRVGKPFIAINCAAIPEQLVESTLFGHEKGAFTGAISRSLGKFREADGGTIFLDEVGELPIGVQAKLLRVLQQKEVEPVGAGKTSTVNVRIISATNRNLQYEVQQGQFREDLFFRLNVLPLHMPNLHARYGDIPKLVNHFIERFSAQHNMPPKEISTQAMALLQAHQWKGNVRELENVVQRALVLGEDSVMRSDEVDMALNSIASSAANDMPSPSIHLLASEGHVKTIKDVERETIAFALFHHKGNVTQTAKSLGMAKPTLYRRLNELNLKG